MYFMVTYAGLTAAPEIKAQRQKNNNKGMIEGKYGSFPSVRNKITIKMTIIVSSRKEER